MRATGLLALLLASLFGSGVTGRHLLLDDWPQPQGSCPTGSNIAAAALAPAGGLDPAITSNLNSKTLFMAALADMAYTREIGLLPDLRQPVDACLARWGAAGPAAVLDAPVEGGGVSHATLFRTGHDVFLLFRGLDDEANIPIGEDVVPVPVADYLGVPLEDPDRQEVWVLQGYLRSQQAIEAQYMPKIDQLVAELPPEARASYRLWVVGHSDGSSVAQIAVPRLITSPLVGAAHLGGVFLFGPQRVGGPAFARFYNAGPAGPVTIRYQYGFDPAYEQLYLASDGLHNTGHGFTACPVDGKWKEKMVHVPLGQDVPAVCEHLAKKVLASGGGAATRGGGLRRGFYKHHTASGGGDGGSGNDSSSLRFLAHHIPSVFYDGLLRLLGSDDGGAVDPCALAALTLPECTSYSAKCSAALRPDPRVSKQCAACGTDATCVKWWGGAAGGLCDTTDPVNSGSLCYPAGQSPGGLYGGLFGYA